MTAQLIVTYPRKWELTNHGGHNETRRKNVGTRRPVQFDADAGLGAFRE